MIAELFATLKAIQSIAASLQAANDFRMKYTEEYIEKEIFKFKDGVRNELEQIKIASSDADRKRLLLELSRKLSN